MSDLIGVGKLGEKLIEELSAATGVRFTARAARAQAEAIRLIGGAQASVEEERARALARAESYRRITLAAAEEQIEIRAERRKRQSELNRQRNLESIGEEALNEIVSPVSEAPVDPDWMTQFIELAQEVSNPEMQKFWARLLAQEVAEPGRFSIKSLQVLQAVTHREVESFERICRCLVSFAPDYATHLVGGYWGSKGLEEIDLRDFGVAYPDILNAQAVGLMYSERMVKPVWDADLFFHGKRIHITLRNPRVWFKPRKEVGCNLSVYLLTPVGIEMSRLVPAAPNIPYGDALQSLLSKQFRVDAG